MLDTQQLNIWPKQYSEQLKKYWKIDTFVQIFGMTEYIICQDNCKYLPGESGQNCIHINLICYGILINLNKFDQISGLRIYLVSGKVLDQRSGKINGQKFRGRISNSKQYQKNAIHFWLYKKFKHLDRYPAINFAQYSFKNYWPNLLIWPNLLGLCLFPFNT